jgi:hypothetical protein
LCVLDLDCNPDKSVTVLSLEDSLDPHRHCKVPFYVHWFGVKLVELLTHARGIVNSSDSDIITLKLDGKDFTVDRKSLKVASDDINTFANISKANSAGNLEGIMGFPNLLKCEITYTAFYQCILSTFLNLGSKGMCVHQAPSRKRTNNPEVSDIGIAPLFLGARYPAPYIATWDCKTVEEGFDIADRKSALYQCNNLELAEGVERTEWPVTIGMPGTNREVELQIYVPVSKGMLWRAAICKCEPWDEALLATFYVAVHYLIEHPVLETKATSVPLPFKDMNGAVPVHEDDMNFRVYKFEDKVVKLYKKTDCFEHNHSLLDKIGFQHELLDHGSFWSLSRPYSESSHCPNSLGTFKSIIKILQKVHDNGYVHGDIRPANLLHGEEDGMILDFDLARPEGTHYLDIYNRIIKWKGRNIRHSEAAPLREMKKEHDRYSLSLIIELSFPGNVEAKKVSELLRNKDITLNEIITLCW